MKARIGIGEKETANLGKILNTLLADEFVLYTKTRRFHWNVVGSDFGELHKFFEEQYEALDDIQKHPITPDEMRRAKDAILNSFIFAVDSKDKLLTEQLTYAFYGYPSDFLERILGLPFHYGEGSVASVAALLGADQRFETR